VNAKYPKNEKLKSKTLIELLFKEGSSQGVYPLRLVFVKNTENEQHKMGVSVSKKYFKKAVDRNYYKRVLRECYRKNKEVLYTDVTSSYAFMFFYQTKEKLSYQEVEKLTQKLFEKVNKSL
jgi:ribonuclease P protein component